MRPMVVVWGMASGCAEHWYAYDSLEADVVAPARFGVRVTTTPEAYPRDLYDAAMRVAFVVDGAVLDETARQDDPTRGRLRLEGGADRDWHGGPDWVNVLDAWDDCDRGAPCVRDFWFTAECGPTCSGSVVADAFLATSPLPEPDRGGSLTLELLVGDGGGIVAP